MTRTRYANVKQRYTSSDFATVSNGSYFALCSRAVIVGAALLATAAAESLVNRRLLLPEDAAFLIKQAGAAAVP
jgi:hypothetical protein